MRLARRALFVALAMLVLCAAASAQTLRLETDPRNISPAVGTGGNPGGPTGLFTIYDGDTLRRGEFTFSLSYSNFDRDPGNVDIVEIPVSFQIGLNDHIELFFNTDTYRGIKVNSPRNLSGFYLPNIVGAGGQSNPAIILAPSGPNVGSVRGAVFRPTGNQPFVQFPFTGGSAGTFGQGPGSLGSVFGFPGFNATLGPPVSAGGGRFDKADVFPGIGSPVGGILPGVVLATSTLPGTLLSQPLEVPATFTVAPSYLPDAPFIGRTYGESSFSTMTFGGKIKFTSPNNPLSFGIVPFYKLYWDKADDLSGFNQLQRGASPGANFGDWGAILFLSGRLSRSVNISVNGGYVLTSNPKGTFPNGEFTLLDRKDELLTGIGFDFPINEHFQPVAELRATKYVSSGTHNAFNNNPVDALLGIKIYPKRWFGFSAAWRYHINQQDQGSFDGADANIPIGQITGVVVNGNSVTVPATVISATSGGFPRGFIPSDDANGFIFQVFAGHRNARIPAVLPNQAPTVTLSASQATVTRPCPPGTSSATCTPSAQQSVTLSAAASDPDGDTLLYTYSTTGGRVTGEGANATWDLTGVAPGTYTSTVEVDDGCGCVSFSSTTVTVADCTDCRPPCPTITVDCPTGAVNPGDPATVTVNVSGGDPSVQPTFNWSVSAGTITAGQGTNSITIDTTGLGGQNVTATVELGGLPPECQRTASCSFSVTAPAPKECQKFDEYGNIRFNDEKARLDNFAIQLQNDPTATGYIIAYADRTGPEGQASARGNRAKDYLVTTRGIDASRIVVVDGGCRETLTVELFVCPTGATAPAATNTVPCEPRPARPARRRGRRRGE